MSGATGAPARSFVRCMRGARARADGCLDPLLGGVFGRSHSRSARSALSASRMSERVCVRPSAPSIPLGPLARSLLSSPLLLVLRTLPPSRLRSRFLPG